MYDYCRRNVPVERAAAITAVLALDQRLGDNSPALRARLGSSSRINRHDLTTSICSFVGDHRSSVFDFCKKVRPCIDDLNRLW